MGDGPADNNYSLNREMQCVVHMQGRERWILMWRGHWKDITEQGTPKNRSTWDLNSIAKLLIGRKGVLGQGHGSEQRPGEKG